MTFAWATSNVFSQVDVSFHRIWEDGVISERGINLRQVVIDQFRRRRNAFLLLGAQPDSPLPRNEEQFQEAGSS